MSYDLHLFRPTPGLDAVEEALSLMEEGDPGPADFAAEGWRRETADSLRAAIPALEEVEFDFGGIAEVEGTTPEEARRRWSHVELHTPGGDSGMQVALRDWRADVALPYWHDGAAAEAAWREVWTVVGVLGARGLSAFDPQLGRILHPAADRAEVEALYADTIRAVRRATDDEAGVERPWWKLWG